ncbi:MAG: hypothetical protein KJP15_10875, partial [Gammaproteobacteria bacterium]|nr:hypothetical protein [Gammaproteobacteria bacterium]
MIKTVSLLLSLAVVPLVLAPNLAGADHDRTIHASGTWTYDGPIIKQWEYEDEAGTPFVDALGEEEGEWTGTFEGT